MEAVAEDYNLLVDVLPCPVCGEGAPARVPFRVGPCKFYEYKLGEKVDWSRKGPVPFPAQKGKAQLKQTVRLKPCAGCVERRAAAAQAVRKLLEDQERLGKPELVDGVYDEKPFIEAELDRLGYPPAEESDATLVLKEGALSEVLPAKPSKPKPSADPILRLRGLESGKPSPQALAQARGSVERLLALDGAGGAPELRELAAALNALLVLGGRGERAWLAELAARPHADEVIPPLLDLARQALDYRLEGRFARVGYVIERVADASWLYRPTLFEAVEIKRSVAKP